MAWYDRIIKAIGNAFQPQEKPQEQLEQPSSVEQPQEPSWLDRVLGNAPNDNREQVERDLSQWAPQDEEQGLFYLGFVDKNLSPEARRNARDQFQRDYGRLDDEQWARWRRQRGYV